jgi:hypothetical protein
MADCGTDLTRKNNYQLELSYAVDPYMIFMAEAI